MDSDLLDVGSQCSQNNCRQIDFLPIRCSCDLYFCRDHILPDAHTCRLLSAATPHSDSSDPAAKFQRCAFAECNKASLDAFSSPEAKQSASCSQCHLAFCAEHRYPDAHSCSPRADKDSSSSGTKNDTARALLAKHFSPKASESQTGTQASGVSKTPTDPAKLAQLRKVQLMKMRHRAIPADPKDKPTSVSVNDRFHIRLHVDAKEEKVYWVRKTIVTGKAIDLLAQATKIKTPLRLFEVAEDRQLENSQPLASQIEDGALLMLRPPLSVPPMP